MTAVRVFRQSRRSLQLAVWVYATAVAALWVAITFAADRLWPATLLAFGPRWIAAVPILPLAVWAAVAARRDRRWHPLVIVMMSALVVTFGVMDLRLGFGRASGQAQLRVMTHNLGASRVSAEALDRLMRRERIDVAALQECPFYDFAPARFGWEFFYGGNLCLISRFPFTVLDEAEPEKLWMRGAHIAMRFAVQSPMGRFEVVNVHLETVRGGLEALAARGFAGVPNFLANRDSAKRDSQRALKRTTARTGPLLVAGDFNLPVESITYRAHWSHLSNGFSQCGRGVGHTKLTRTFGIRIDHVLFGAEWRCTEARVLASPYGGDHRPVIVGLRLQ